MLSMKGNATIPHSPKAKSSSIASSLANSTNVDRRPAARGVPTRIAFPLPLLDGDVDEFNALFNQYQDQQQRFYEWCMLAARIEEGVIVPIHKTEGEHQRVGSVRDKNSKEKSRATLIRFVATVVFALLLGILVFKIR